MSRFSILFVILLMPVFSYAQADGGQTISSLSFSTDKSTLNLQATSPESKLPSPAGALLRSFVLPGWGHYYVDSKNWNRGLMHLGADLALIGAYTGYSLSANRIENNLKTFASQHAGVNLSSRSRDFLLSVGEFNSLEAYNDFQLRSRNWDKILQVNTQNYWNWDTDQNRRSFVSMDTRVQDQRQQLPAIVSLMVVNRIISGIHAFTQARGLHNGASAMSVTVPSTGVGLQANYQLAF